MKNGGSNGAGKSAIVAGIVWTLFGKDHVGRSGKDVVRWGQKTCTGILTITGQEHTYEILRSLEELEFQIDGIRQVGNKRELQDTINRTFSTDYSLFTTFNVFTKTWSKFITEIGDAERKKLFKNVLRMGQLDEAQDKAKKIYANLSVQATKAETLVNQIKTALPQQEQELQSLKTYRDQAEQIAQKAIADLRAKKELSKPHIVDISEEKAELEAKIAKIDATKLNKSLEDLTVQLSNLNGILFYEQESIQQKDQAIKSFTATGNICPTCGQDIPAKHRQVYRRNLEILKQELMDVYEENLKHKEEIENELYQINQQLQELKEYANKLKELEMIEWKNKIDMTQYEELCKSTDEAIAQIEQQAKLDSYSELIKQAEEKLLKLQENFKTQETLFESYTNEMDVYNYLIWLYSRQGVISVIIERYFNRLKSLANRYLRQISNEGFTIDISPQKALKSGEMREEIDLYIWDEEQKVPYASLSSGQQQRINTALLFALYAWGKEIGVSQFDFVILDEIMDLSLDLKGQDTVLEMLYAMRNLIYQILLITHKEGLAGQFDRTLEVVRNEAGISKLMI
jgi:DNA repair exonuclease SbcCD ATPase subunit